MKFPVQGSQFKVVGLNPEPYQEGETKKKRGQKRGVKKEGSDLWI
jgi:hypothetical protein